MALGYLVHLRRIQIAYSQHVCPLRWLWIIGTRAPVKTLENWSPGRCLLKLGYNVIMTGRKGTYILKFQPIPALWRTAGNRDNRKFHSILIRNCPFLTLWSTQFLWTPTFKTPPHPCYAVSFSSPPGSICLSPTHLIHCDYILSSNYSCLPFIPSSSVLSYFILIGFQNL